MADRRVGDGVLGRGPRSASRRLRGAALRRADDGDDETGAVLGRAGPGTFALLEHQARVAEEHGNPQLAANFRRAAELAALDDVDVVRIYEALRPRRSSVSELEALAAWLSSRGADLNAALVREAAAVYQRRGLCR